MKSRRDHELLILLHNCKAYEKILTEKLPQLKIQSASHPEEALDFIEEAYVFSDWWFSVLTGMDSYFALKKQSWVVLTLRKVMAPIKRLLYRHDDLFH